MGKKVRVGVIHFLSAHDSDLLRWYFANEPIEVHAYGGKGVLSARGIDTYDLIQALVEFTDSFVEVIGSAAHLHFDRKRESIALSTEAKFTYPKALLMQEIFEKLRRAFVECLNDFLAAILDDIPPQVKGFDGRHVTAVLGAGS